MNDVLQDQPVRILVLRGGAIGDFILTLPALSALRKQWPNSHIELVAYPHIGCLALAGGLVDVLHSFDRYGMHQLYGRPADMDIALKRYLSSFDFVLSYLHDPEGVVRDNGEAAGVVQWLYESPIVEEGHAVDVLLRPLANLAVYPDDREPRLDIEASLKHSGRQLLDELGVGATPVAIHPGSGSARKNWPITRFVEVAQRISATSNELFFIIGESDAGEREVLAEALPRVPIIEDRTLLEIAGTLAHASLFLGNDSGITHLAAASQCRTVALFGPSRADQWCPLGKHVTVFEADDGELASISTEDVWSLLSAHF